MKEIVKCEDCKDRGWIDSNNAKGEDETQKCDSCNKFKTDREAQMRKEIDKYRDAFFSDRKDDDGFCF